MSYSCTLFIQHQHGICLDKKKKKIDAGVRVYVFSREGEKIESSGRLAQRVERMARDVVVGGAVAAVGVDSC